MDDSKRRHYGTYPYGTVAVMIVVIWRMVTGGYGWNCFERYFACSDRVEQSFPGWSLTNGVLRPLPEMKARPGRDRTGKEHAGRPAAACDLRCLHRHPATIEHGPQSG